MRLRFLYSLSLCLGFSVLFSCERNDVEPQPATAYISKVYEYVPAPGQFINKLPEFVQNDTKEQLIAKASRALVGKKNGSPISLGGFGGYIVFGFDHTVKNIEGKRDFRVLGNAFFANSLEGAENVRGGSCEPGIVMVSYDANKNGLPDDKWFEIAGSEYINPKSVRNYEITYFRPTTEQGSGEGHILIDNYIRWEDNQGNLGYISKNRFNVQPYFPQWINKDRISFEGTLLPSNGIDMSEDGTNWVLFAYGKGYVDNAPNNDPDSAIDISWAVDESGNAANLEGIDFVKVYTAVNQSAGWIGETSTEISGAYDLHIVGESVASN